MPLALLGHPMSRPGHIVLLAKANDARSKVPKLSHAPLRGRGVRERKRMALDHRDGCSHLTTASGVRARTMPKDAGTSHRAEGQSTSIEPRLYARRSRTDGLRLGRANIPRNIPQVRTRGRQADAQRSSTLVPPEQEHYKGRYEDDRRSKENHRARRPPTVPMTSRAVPQHVREARWRRLCARPHCVSCMQRAANKQTDHMQHAMCSVQHDTQRSPLAVRHCTCGGADWAVSTTDTLQLLFVWPCAVRVQTPPHSLHSVGAAFLSHATWQ
jgi:hypothetical protein